MRKVTVTLTINLMMTVEDGQAIDDVINEMDYTFSTDDATIMDSEIVDFALTDTNSR